MTTQEGPVGNKLDLGWHLKHGTQGAVLGTWESVSSGWSGSEPNCKQDPASAGELGV